MERIIPFEGKKCSDCIFYFCNQYCTRNNFMTVDTHACEAFSDRWELFRKARFGDDDMSSLYYASNPYDMLSKENAKKFLRSVFLELVLGRFKGNFGDDVVAHHKQHILNSKNFSKTEFNETLQEFVIEYPDKKDILEKYLFI